MGINEVKCACNPNSIIPVSTPPQAHFKLFSTETKYIYFQDKHDEGKIDFLLKNRKKGLQVVMG